MIAIKRKDGGLSLMTLIGGGTVMEEVEKWKGCHPDELEHVAYIADQDLPKDRSRRSEWVLRDGKVVIPELSGINDLG